VFFDELMTRKCCWMFAFRPVMVIAAAFVKDEYTTEAHEPLIIDA
jgi:hypothetical protein